MIHFDIFLIMVDFLKIFCGFEEKYTQKMFLLPWKLQNMEHELWIFYDWN